MILFNGATGGLGRHLGPHLVRTGAPHAALSTRIERSSELLDELETTADPSDGSPVVLVHLAAMVSVAACESDPEAAWAINVEGAAAYVRAFVDWAVERGRRPSVVYVSTGHVYAPPQEGTPVTEEAPVGPRSVYATTKLEGEAAVAAVAGRESVPLTVARVFGLVAPGQPATYLLPGLIDRVRRDDVQGIPGLRNVRDYLDARDVVAHLGDIAARPPAVQEGPVVINVCSGIGMTVRDVLEAVIAGVHGAGSDRAAAVMRSVTEAPGRPTDVRWLVGSPQRLIDLTGRAAQSIPLRETVHDAIAAR